MKNIRYAVAAVVSLVVTGCTAAVATSTTAAPRTTETGAGKAVASPVLTHITVYSVNTDAPVLSSIVSGPALSSGCRTRAPG